MKQHGVPKTHFMFKTWLLLLTIDVWLKIKVVHPFDFNSDDTGFTFIKKEMTRLYH